MQSEVEKLVERLRNYRPPTVDGYGYPPGQEPREHHTICDEAASLIERLYRERERLREATRPLVYAATGLSHGEDWNNGTHAKLHGYRQKLLDALPEAKAALAEQPQ